MNNATSNVGAVRVQAWPSERPLYVVILLLSLLCWFFFAISIIGAAYALMIGVFFVFAHAIFIAHLRGSGVRLGPQQLPELYQRVAEISARLGLPKTPDAYVLQQGGVLNALATRFFGSNFIVLYSDLLDACGDNTDACDFIIAHELGHLRAGHLQRRWLILPGLLTPLLGAAYSRACEYTSDRYGMAASRDRQRALDGLVILAAGPRQAPHVNRRALVTQTHDLQGFWMTLGRLLATHPPIADRLGVLDADLSSARAPNRDAALVLVILLLALVIPVAGFVGMIKFFQGMTARVQQMQQATSQPAGFEPPPFDPPGADPSREPPAEDAPPPAQEEPSH